MSFVDRYENLLRSPLFWIAVYLMFLLLSPIVSSIGGDLREGRPVRIDANDFLQGVGFSMYASLFFPLGILGLIGLVMQIIPVSFTFDTLYYSMLIVPVYWICVLLFVLRIRKCGRPILGKLALFIFLLGLLTLIGCSNITVPIRDL